MNEKWPEPAGWPVEPHDAEGQALAEGWAALRHLLGPSDVPLDAVTAARLIAAVEADERSRRRRPMFAVVAVAAVALLALSPWLVRRPAESQTEVNAGNAPSIVADSRPGTALNAWDDPLEQDLADVRDYVREVELSWSRDEDRISALRERMQLLENQWNEGSL